MKTEIIYISKDENKKWQKILNRENRSADYPYGDVIKRFCADFGDGIEADIKVCNGDAPYIDSVLFQNGKEVKVLDVSDCLIGDYPFEYKGDIYMVKIKTR